MYPKSNDLTRARLLAFNDAGDFQTADVRGFAGETFTKVHRFQSHGFSSHPPTDAVGVFLRMGETDRLVSLGFETAQRPRNLPAGGTALYDQHGNVLKMINSRIDLEAAGTPVTIKCSTLRFEGDFGVVTFDGSGIKHNGKNIGDTHVHGGIVVGGANTAVPAN